MLRPLVAAYPTQAGTTTMYTRYVWGHTYSDCAPQTVDRYMNNARIRRRIMKGLLEFMAFGTTGSEAFNASLKSWFGRVANPHAPTIRLKLRISHISKFAEFCSARYHEATVQERQSMAMCSAIRDM